MNAPLRGIFAEGVHVPDLSPFDVQLLKDMLVFGGAIFNPALDGGRLLIGNAIYTARTHPAAILALRKLEGNHYVISEQGVVFNVTDAGVHRAESAR